MESSFNLPPFRNFSTGESAEFNINIPCNAFITVAGGTIYGETRSTDYSEKELALIRNLIEIYFRNRDNWNRFVKYLQRISKKEGEKVVSMLFVVPLEMVCEKVAYIYAVATHPDYRGRGIASRLLGEALDMIRRSGVYDLAALIPSSTESKRLYKRLGFEDTQMPMEFPASDYLGTGSAPHDLAMTIKL